MATDWANALNWGGAQNFTLPTEFEIARSAKNWTDYRNDVSRFDPTQQNAALLSSLGYGGQALSDNAWTDDALGWLSSQGYQLGVGHQPGTSSGGRSEYFGLIDGGGKFVQGQSDPTMRTSDTLMDQITPFAMFLAPTIAGIAAAGGGAAAAGAGAGAGSGGAAGGLGAGAEGLSALGSAWSPQALGLTSLAPSTAAAEIAALSSALPGAVGAGGLGALGGLGGEGVASLGSSWSPSALGLTESIAPAISSSELAALGSLPGAGSGLLNGIKSAADLVGGGSNLAALVGAGLGAASGGGTETQSRDPWSAAQPFLKNILADADAMRANLADNPFTQQQTQAYQNAYGGLDQARAALPGLLSWGQNAMQRQSTTPTYASLFGGGQQQQAQPQQMPQQPTMQAGGPGGLLGGAPEDRLKALMASGRGLLG